MIQFIHLDKQRRVNVNHIIGYEPDGEMTVITLTSVKMVAGEIKNVAFMVDLPVTDIDKLIAETWYRPLI